MTKASDNQFPSMLYVEQGSTPASPSSGQQRLFVRSSDHVLCMVDSSGTVTPLSGALTDPTTTRGDMIYRGASALARRAVGASGKILTSDGTDPQWGNGPMTTRGDIMSAGASGAIQRLALGTAGYGLVSDGTDALWAEILPWHVPVLPTVQDPDATTGTWALQGFTDAVTFPFVQPSGSVGAMALFNSTNAQNDAISWDLVLAKGTWSCNIHVRKSSNTAIITLNQDGSSQGTVDTYAASPAYAKVSITGWTVATTGKHTMQLKAATRNASSTGWEIEIFAIDFRRTA